MFLKEFQYFHKQLTEQCHLKCILNYTSPHSDVHTGNTKGNIQHVAVLPGLFTPPTICSCIDEDQT